MAEPKSFFLTPKLSEYLVAHSTPIDEVQQWLIDETRAQVGRWVVMQIPPEQGAFMTLLTQLLDVHQAIEIGTFTGYSSLAIARGLPSNGSLLCCDISEEWTALAREAWTKAGVDHQIELRIAPAIETLRSLPSDLVIDLVFIDADKPAYKDYYEELLPRMRQNGVILVDNVLWSGRVVEPTADDDENTAALKEFNDHVAADPRVESTILTIGDGLTVIRKR